ncbi:MAG: branched-chain amino acid transaminase [Anaerolineales bacterium]|nr:branched-chain amino acid transaminase [Anaerolineales bacterium]
MTTLAYFKGEIVPIEQATISINNNTLHYGTGCFAGIRAYWNDEHEQLYIFRVIDHYERFLASARLLRCQFEQTAQDLADITVDLLAREGWQQNVYIRPIAYKDDGIYKVQLHGMPDEIAIFSQAIGDYLDTQSGLSVCVSSWRRVDDTAIPARGKINGAYVNSAMAKSDAVLSGYDEAIVLNQDGHVSEATAANFMMVRGGVLVTPPISSNLLEGITRRSLIELAKEELGIEVQERQIDRSELYLADEAFFCGTGVQMAFIGSIDHRPVGNGQRGPITQQLGDLQIRILRGQEAKYRHWVTPVHQKEAVG